VNARLVFIFVLTVGIGTAWAEDEESIKGLRDAVVKLAPSVDPAEADLFSVTVHTKSRSLAREYGVTGDPAFHNFLINTGQRKRGYCAHYARDIGTRLKELQFKTLALHWGAYYPHTSDESNCLVVTARNQPFLDGIVIDGWRHGGRLFWCAVKKDIEYEWHRQPSPFGHPHSGITAWKEDMQETAWLQAYQPVATNPPPKKQRPQKGRKSAGAG
jgi:hypothetical protein